MILEHYSKLPLGEVRASEQSTLPCDKPCGLWLSVKGPRDWLSYARSRVLLRGKFGHCATFQLAARANVLHLTTPAEIDTFHELYSVPTNPAIAEHREPDWAVVASKFDGIVIAPYQPTRRHCRQATWYYGWDCACACVWAPRALERSHEHQPGAKGETSHDPPR
jgi:hypothetical protein